MAGNRMNELEMYKETLKAVHNEYNATLKSVEATLLMGAEYGFLTRDDNIESTIQATLHVARKALKDKMDELLREIEENERA